MPALVLRVPALAGAGAAYTGFGGTGGRGGCAPGGLNGRPRAPKNCEMLSSELQVFPVNVLRLANCRASSRSADRSTSPGPFAEPKSTIKCAGASLRNQEGVERDSSPPPNRRRYFAHVRISRLRARVMPT